MRTTLALVLSVALQPALLAGFLVHAHPDDCVTAHHTGRALHAHWTGHNASSGRSDGPTVAADDHDRAVYFDAYVANAAASLAVAGITGGVFELTRSEAQGAHRLADVIHGHDPPALASRSSRAPPARLF